MADKETRPDLKKWSSMDLKSAVVLVTGGSSGIGEGLAVRVCPDVAQPSLYITPECFLSAGSTVVVTGRREENLKEATQRHPGLHYIISDASEAQSRQELRDRVLKDYPKLNILVNNAGTQRRLGLPDEPEDWSKRAVELHLNLEAPIHLSWLFTPHLQRQKEAAIINVTSGLAYFPTAFAPTYGASKAALASWTKAARYHYRNTQIRIVEIAPPAVKSNLGGSHDYGEDCDEFCDHVFKRFAAGEIEVGYKLGEDARLGDREDNLARAHKLAYSQQYSLY